MLKAAVIGASGYTGAELLRILAGHPEIEVKRATAGRYAGTPVAELFPSLTGVYDGVFEGTAVEGLVEDCDVAFVGLPHGESMKVLPTLVESGAKVVDLSADMRFEDPAEYELHYGTPHSAPSLLADAVYGLPEVNRDKLKGTSLVSNPGCYPTGALLGLYPAARAGVLGSPLIIDAKSGVSGAGRKLTLETHYPQVADGVEPYAVGEHRHRPEISGRLAGLMGESGVEVFFTPHLVPMNRGILSTMYLPLAEGASPEEARALYEDAYSDEPFVSLLPGGSFPGTKPVQGSNNCHVGVEMLSGGMLVVMTAIDNLVKGASGQAVQNMNIMCGLPEETGLTGAGLFP